MCHTVIMVAFQMLLLQVSKQVPKHRRIGLLRFYYRSQSAKIKVQSVRRIGKQTFQPMGLSSVQESNATGNTPLKAQDRCSQSQSR